MTPDDAAFLRDFEAAAIPQDRWHHRDHVRVAYLYLTTLPYDAALARVRDGIVALNRAHGGDAVPPALDRGYHETMTVAWLRLVAATLARWGPEDGFDAFADVHGYLLHRRLTRLFYSRERLLTWEAKRAFVEPDLLPLPTGMFNTETRRLGGRKENGARDANGAVARISTVRRERRSARPRPPFP